MKTVMRRLRHLEERLVPTQSLASLRAAEILRERRRRRLEASGLSLDQPLNDLARQRRIAVMLAKMGGKR